MVTHWICNVAIGQNFMAWVDAFGLAAVYAGFAGASLLGAAYIQANVPETKVCVCGGVNVVRQLCCDGARCASTCFKPAECLHFGAQLCACAEADWAHAVTPTRFKPAGQELC